MKILRPKRPAAAGLSLVDMIVTVSIVGIMSAVAVAGYKNFYESSSTAVARNTVETMNYAVSKYLQLEGTKLYDMVAVDGNADDEMKVLYNLQWDDGSPGQPYMRNDFRPGTSSSTDDYRAIWNGSTYELKTPGETGAGIKIELSGVDFGRPVSFPGDFTPN
ncbi:MAG: type II secretory pathway pseudopilin PulG [Verrucomicrobiales bacterium]|jgi:type II secretory pathway pseudopilin PulG